MNNPETEEVVKTLRFEADINVGSNTSLVCEVAADLIGQLQQELVDERYRHDRLQGFCVAQGEELSKLKEQRRWIPVTERLPDTYEKDPDWSTTVLFMTSQGHVHSGYRNVGRAQKSFYDDDWTPPYWLDESENLSFEEEEVTHWMPLPEPPKE